MAGLCALMGYAALKILENAFVMKQGAPPFIFSSNLVHNKNPALVKSWAISCRHTRVLEFGNPAIQSIKLHWTCSFASPPYDEFAHSLTYLLENLEFGGTCV
jgi:hypothetical protein